MPLSIEGRPSADTAIRVVCAALDAGMDLIDTADAYCLDESEVGHGERLVGRAVLEWAGGTRPTIATKGGVRRAGGQWQHDGRPEYLAQACHASLRALGLNSIPLYQLHAPDETTRFEDSVGALARMRETGLIETVGLSNINVDQLACARSIVPIASVQNEASPYKPEGLHDGVLEACEKHGIAFIAYAPMGGWRAGRIAHEPVLQSIARERGATPFQVVIAWLLAQSKSIVTIPGASRTENVIASAAAQKVQLTASDLSAIDQAFVAKTIPIDAFHMRPRTCDE